MTRAINEIVPAGTSVQPIDWTTGVGQALLRTEHPIGTPSCMTIISAITFRRRSFNSFGASSIIIGGRFSLPTGCDKVATTHFSMS
jgi:hypothetical protein